MSATGRVDEQGFTLIEMLVVLAVSALLSGLAFPQVERAIARQTFQREVQATQANLAEARARAIATGAPIRFLPVVSKGLEMQMPPHGVWFFADGSSSGGLIALSSEERIARLAVSGPTGAIVLSR